MNIEWGSWLSKPIVSCLDHFRARGQSRNGFARLIEETPENCLGFRSPRNFTRNILIIENPPESKHVGSTGECRLYPAFRWVNWLLFPVPIRRLLPTPCSLVCRKRPLAIHWKLSNLRFRRLSSMERPPAKVFFVSEGGISLSFYLCINSGNRGSLHYRRWWGHWEGGSNWWRYTSCIHV